MAHFTGFSAASIQISTDGIHWHDLRDAIVGSLYIEDHTTGTFAEITPDNPLYAELVELLAKSESWANDTLTAGREHVENGR